MKINNLTPFDSSRLREIAMEVARRELDSSARNGIIVYFITRKSHTADTQRARLHGYYRRVQGRLPVGLKYNVAIVTISKDEGTRCPRATAQSTALLLAHEFAEMRGLSHEAMRTPRYFFRDNWVELYSWADALPLVLAAVKRKGRPTTDKKMDHALQMVQKWATKTKRDLTMLKKWQRKYKGYQRKLAATPATPVATPVATETLSGMYPNEQSDSLAG